MGRQSQQSGNIGIPKNPVRNLGSSYPRQSVQVCRANTAVLDYLRPEPYRLDRNCKAKAREGRLRKQLINVHEMQLLTLLVVARRVCLLAAFQHAEQCEGEELALLLGCPSF